MFVPAACVNSGATRRAVSAPDEGTGGRTGGMRACRGQPAWGELTFQKHKGRHASFQTYSHEEAERGQLQKGPVPKHEHASKSAQNSTGMGKSTAETEATAEAEACIKGSSGSLSRSSGWRAGRGTATGPEPRRPRKFRRHWRTVRFNSWRREKRNKDEMSRRGGDWT